MPGSKLIASTRKLQSVVEMTSAQSELDIACTNGSRIKVSPAKGKSIVCDVNGEPVNWVKKVIVTTDGNGLPIVEMQRLVPTDA